VFGLAEIKQVGWFEHAGTVTKHPQRESVIFVGVNGGHRPPLPLKAHFQNYISVVSLTLLYSDLPKTPTSP
jgi:hypothetical protein